MARRKEDAQFNVRLSKPLLKRLQSAARDSNRSVNSEIVYRIGLSFSPGGLDQVGGVTQAVLDHAVDTLMSSDNPGSELSLFRRSDIGRWLAKVLSEELYKRAGRAYVESKIAEGDRIRRLASEAASTSRASPQSDQEPELPTPRHKGPSK